uniref:Uncharacterized protein n=1 Tax=Steinernema glaseri TaxID=37863 RepID=A0A1I7Z054_9BILA
MSPYTGNTFSHTKRGNEIAKGLKPFAKAHPPQYDNGFQFMESLEPTLFGEQIARAVRVASYVTVSRGGVQLVSAACTTANCCAGDSFLERPHRASADSVAENIYSPPIGLSRACAQTSRVRVIPSGDASTVMERALLDGTSNKNSFRVVIKWTRTATYADLTCAFA